MKKIVIIVGVAVLVIALFAFNQPEPNSSDSSSFASKELKLVDAITHGHGLAVDVEDPNKVYIATHHGLLLLQNEQELYQVGDSKDDYMGFSPHPTNSKVFFSSGHPSFGGNIGFQRSDDGGFTWKKISNGVNGPVDFHAMVVSPVNPNIIYGWYHGSFQLTTDGGKKWQIASNTDFPVIALAADARDEKVVYAASPQGLFVSRDMGSSFKPFFDGFVSAIAVDPFNPQALLSFSEKYGLAKSNDGGKSWEEIDEDFSGETPLFISFSKQKPEIIYILTEKNSLYKSTDSGSVWNKIR